MILFAARRRQGGAGGGAINRAALKLVGNRGGSHDADDNVTGAVTAAVFCFFFLDAKFNFCAALREESQKKGERKETKINQINILKLFTAFTNTKYFKWINTRD